MLLWGGICLEFLLLSCRFCPLLYASLLYGSRGTCLIICRNSSILLLRTPQCRAVLTLENGIVCPWCRICLFSAMFLASLRIEWQLWVFMCSGCTTCDARSIVSGNCSLKEYPEPSSSLNRSCSFLSMIFIISWTRVEVFRRKNLCSKVSRVVVGLFGMNIDGCLCVLIRF